MGTYLKFMEDEKLIAAVAALCKAYEKGYSAKTLKDLNKNVFDPFKFQFDTILLNAGDNKKTLKNEICRQSDKSISNAVGLFHQQLIGAIDGFCETPDMPCDVKKCDDTIFVEVKNKHNTMNIRSAAGVYEELEGIAKGRQGAMCYLVEIIGKKSVDEVWKLTVNKKTMLHPKIHKISVDKFYALATGCPDAFKQLCGILPKVISDYLAQKQEIFTAGIGVDKVYSELEANAKNNGVCIEEAIFKMAFDTYQGFKK